MYNKQTDRQTDRERDSNSRQCNHKPSLHKSNVAKYVRRISQWSTRMQRLRQHQLNVKVGSVLHQQSSTHIMSAMSGWCHTSLHLSVWHYTTWSQS